MNAYHPEQKGKQSQPALDLESPNDPGVVKLHEAIVREHAEPRDGYEPAPVWLLFFYLTVMGIAGWYLGMYSGAFSRDIYEESPAAWMAMAQQPAGATTLDPMVLGKRVFARCASCHQAAGTGLPGTYPPLAGSPWVQGRPEVLAGILLRGIIGPLEVHGVTYNEEMPTWRALSDHDLSMVMTYVRGSWGNDAAPVEASLVAQVREYLAAQTGHWTQDELNAFRDAVDAEEISFAEAPAGTSPNEPAVLKEGSHE